MLRKLLNFSQIFIQIVVSLIVQLIVNFQLGSHNRDGAQWLPPVVCQQIEHFSHGGETILNFLILLALLISNVLSGPKECNHLILGIEKRCYVRRKPLCFSCGLIDGSVIKLYFHFLGNRLDATILSDFSIFWDTHLFEEFLIIHSGAKRNAV